MQQEANVMKTTTSTKRHNLTRIAMYCSIMYSGATIGAESVEYDPTFLMGGNASSIDVSRYSDGNPTLPGVYDVSIYVNEQPVATLYYPEKTTTTAYQDTPGIRGKYYPSSTG